MLVLSRHVNERVFLTLPDGRQIVVTLVRTGWEKVRIGFDAPPDVTIHREEVQADIDHREASSRPPREKAPQSAGNGPPCDPRAPHAPEAVPPARVAPRPGEPGYVPLRHRHHGGRA